MIYPMHYWSIQFGYFKLIISQISLTCCSVKLLKLGADHI